MKKLYLLPLLFISIFYCSETHASHDYGGDLTWECVGQDSFTFTLTLYRDCTSLNMSSATLSFNCASTGASITTTNILRPPVTSISPICDGMCDKCTGGACGFAYGIGKYIYNSSIVNLSGAGSCCEILVSCFRTPRHPSITTGLASATINYVAKLNRCLTPCDNSPVFTQEPILNVSVNENVIYNPGVIDIDTDSLGRKSDSLIFSWTPPLGSNQMPLQYSLPYSYNKPIYFQGFPNPNIPFPGGLHLNPQTGDLMFRPTKIEYTVFALKVREYRNGVLIGEITRDVNVNVSNWGFNSNSPPTLSGPYYKEVCVGDTVSFNINSSDPDQSDSTKIYWNQSIPDAIWTDNNFLVKNATGTISWVPGSTDANNKPHKFTVFVKDDNCQFYGWQSRAFSILVKEAPQATISDSSIGCGNYQFRAQTSQTSQAYSWSGQGGLSSSNQVFTHNFHVLGTYPYNVTVTLPNGCSTSFLDTIITDSFITVELPNDTLLCYGNTMNISASYFNNSGQVNFVWNTGDTINQQITVGPLYSDTTIIVAVVDLADSCTSTDSMFIDVHEPVQLGSDIRICNYTDTILYVNYPASNVSYEWTKVGNTTPFSYNDSVILSDSGFFVCKVTDSVGCFSRDTVEVFENPDITAFTPDTTICFGDSVILTAVLTGAGTETYNWFLQDSLLLQQRSMEVSPSVITDYKLVVYENISGVNCSDTDIVSVRINPLPIINITAIPERCKGGNDLLLNDYVIPIGGQWQADNPAYLNYDTFNPAIPGFYLVTYSFTDSIGCTNHDFSIVTVHPLPVVFAGDDDTTCKGYGNYNLTGSPHVPPGTWSGQGVSQSSGNYYFNTDDMTILTGVNYPLVYDYYDSNGCFSSDTMNIIVYETPQPNAGIYGDLCSSDPPLKLKGSPSGGTWTGTGVNDRYFDPSVGEGTYQLIYELRTNGHCPKYAYANLTVLTSPSVYFSGTPLSGTSPLQVYFIDSSSISSGSIDTFSWIFGDGDTSNVKGNVYHTYDSIGVFSVKLIQISNIGCADTFVREDYISTSNIGISEYFNNKEIHISPNPVGDVANIYVTNNSRIKSISFYNTIGEKVKEIKYIENNSYKIIKEAYWEGVYLLIIELDDNRKYYSKIVFF